MNEIAQVIDRPEPPSGGGAPLPDGRRRTDGLLADEKRALEMIAAGAPLAGVLDAVNGAIEARLPGTLCSILLLEAGGRHLRHGSAPSLPESYNRAIDGLEIGPEVGSCGTAAHTGRQVIVSDIAGDPLWADYRELAREHSLAACWSTPIRSSSQETLGTFAIYYRERREPGAPDFEVMERMTHLAGIAIERHQAQESARELSEKLAHQASHDALTGLLNRYELERRLELMLDDARSTGRHHALCYLDLDQFKIINDSCGHAAGDELLRQLGSLLRREVSRRDIVARLGGDEFGVLLEDCSLARAEEVADTLRRAIRDFRFRWREKSFRIGVSIALVPITAASDSLTGILRAADSACYVAKDKGRNRIHTYRPDDAELVRRSGEMKWVNEIRIALEEDRFRLMVQPIVPLGPPRDRKASEARGELFELLLRIEGEDGGLVAPGEFLPAAERYDLATLLDVWVLSAAFDWLGGDPRHLESAHLCSINLSAQSLGDLEFLKRIIRGLEERQIPPEKICFEITETAAIANLAHASRFIRSLRSLGCRFALDDFGTGFSSFAYLKSLPVDFLKIDRIFVKGVLEDRVDSAVIGSMVEIGRLTGKRTIAEGVESESVLRMLERIGVDYAQGYHLGRPHRLEDFSRLRAERAAASATRVAASRPSAGPSQLALPY